MKHKSPIVGGFIEENGPGFLKVDRELVAKMVIAAIPYHARPNTRAGIAAVAHMIPLSTFNGMNVAQMADEIGAMVEYLCELPENIGPGWLNAQVVTGEERRKDPGEEYVRWLSMMRRPDDTGLTHYPAMPSMPDKLPGKGAVHCQSEIVNVPLDPSPQGSADTETDIFPLDNPNSKFYREV